MTKSLLAILLLLPLSGSAGELDGKALACLRKGDSYIRGLEFRDGQAIHWDLFTDGAEAIIEKENTGAYWEYPEQVIYGREPDAFWRFYLDRVTLVLQLRDKDSESIIFEYQCEVSPSLDSLSDVMEQQRSQWQDRIDEAMKDNKI